MTPKHKTKSKTTGNVSGFAMGLAVGGLGVYALLRVSRVSEEERAIRSESVRRAKKMLSDLLEIRKKN